jgi:hypothetical protein
LVVEGIIFIGTAFAVAVFEGIFQDDGRFEVDAVSLPIQVSSGYWGLDISALACSRSSSITTLFKLRVEAFKFNTGISGGKTPVDFTRFLIPSLVPCRRFFPHLFYRGYPW